MILKWIFNKTVSGVDLIDLAQDMDKWRAYMSAVLDICVP
jgi:hypothetical protein